MKLSCNDCDGIYDSLDIRFTKKCDNACSFCIDRTCNFSNQGEVPVNIMIQKTIETGISTVLILGGEPFLLIRKLLEYIKGIRDHVNKIYITTSLPMTIWKDDFTFIDIMRLIDGLNVSFQHYDWEENNKIMNASSNHNRFELLKWITDYYPDKVRVAINLVKEGIDSEWKLDKFILTARNHGARNIKINELCHSEKTYVSYEKIMKIKMKSPYAHGCQSKPFEWYPNVWVIVKRSCFITDGSLFATPTDLLKALIRKIFKISTGNRFAVLYEDGSIYDKWQEGGIKCEK